MPQLERHQEEGERAQALENRSELRECEQGSWCEPREGTKQTLELKKLPHGTGGTLGGGGWWGRRAVFERRSAQIFQGHNTRDVGT